MQRKKQIRREVLLGDTNPYYICHEMAGADENASMNRVSVETTEEGNENSAMKLWPDYSRDAPIEIG